MKPALRHAPRRAARALAWTAAWLPGGACVLWAFGALSHDFPVAPSAVAWIFALAVLAAVVFVRGAWRKLASVYLAFALVLAWWLSLRPSDDRAWQPDVDRTAWTEIDGDVVTLHNVRDCDYRAEFDYTPRWETRVVRLSRLTGIDLAINYWGSPWIAHPVVSFQFSDAPPVCFSIEVRKEIGETYDAIGGLYRRFELIYVVANERDVVRVRTNYRKGEDVFLYRTTFTAEQARERFLEYLRSLDDLRREPRWYNAATTNCTTAIRAQQPPGERMPWDWRFLLNGKGDEMMFERGALATGGLPFDELKRRALINDDAKAADASPDFSKLIREGRPGM
jgi:hypothetical protein